MVEVTGILEFNQLPLLNKLIFRSMLHPILTNTDHIWWFYRRLYQGGKLSNFLVFHSNLIQFAKHTVVN